MLGEREPLSPLPLPLPPVVFLDRVLAEGDDEGDVDGRVLRTPPVLAEGVPPDGRVDGRVDGLALAPAPVPPRPELPA